MADSSPTLRRRLLADELKRLREAASLTMEDVAQRLDISRATVSRIEAGRMIRPRSRDIRDMLLLYGVEETRLNALLALARAAREKGWYEEERYKGLFPGAYVGLEEAARNIATFEPNVIPGLLQTAEYAAALTKRSLLVRDPAEIDRHVEARMKRQEILLKDNPPQYWAIIDEAALLRPVGGVDVQREQIRKLIDTSPLDHVTVQVMEMKVGAHVGLGGPFVILDFELLDFEEEAPRSVVYVETPTDGLYLEKDDHLDYYGRIFRHLHAEALGVDASIAYLSNLIDKL